MRGGPLIASCQGGDPKGPPPHAVDAACPRIPDTASRRGRSRDQWLSIPPQWLPFPLEVIGHRRVQPHHERRNAGSRRRRIPGPHTTRHHQGPGAGSAGFGLLLVQPACGARLQERSLMALFENGHLLLGGDPTPARWISPPMRSLACGRMPQGRGARERARVVAVQEVPSRLVMVGRRTVQTHRWGSGRGHRTGASPKWAYFFCLADSPPRRVTASEEVRP
jgi:hypothetical protein